MNVFLNELSYANGHQYVTQKHFELVKDGLISAVKFFKSASDRQVIYWTGDNIIHHPNHKFFDNKSYKEFLSLLSREERTVLLALFTRLRPLIFDSSIAAREHQTELLSAPILSYLELEGTKFGSLSLFTNSNWESAELKFEYNGNPLTIRNWPRQEFLDIPSFSKLLLSYFKNFICEVNPSDSFLPYSVLSSILFENEEFSAAYNSLSKGDRLAAFQIVGDAVAQLNNYKVHKEANSKNKTSSKKRNIYFNQVLRFFLSIDYEKGAFELLNEKGRHLGEYSFTGKIISVADDTGKHDIKL